MDRILVFAKPHNPAAMGSGAITRKVDLSSSDSINPTSDSFAGSAYSIIAPFIITFGVVGNVLILLVLGCSKGKAGAIKTYLTALAVCDIGALLFWIPLLVRLTNSAICSYVTAFYHAHLELPLLNTFMAASIFIVIALTIERYTAICWPGKYSELQKSFRAKVSVGIAFGAAVVVSLPLTVLKKLDPYSTVKQMKLGCGYGYRENTSVTSYYIWSVYVWLGETLVRFLPGLILALLNCLILIKFRKVVEKRLLMSKSPSLKVKLTSNLQKITSSQTGRRLEEERRLVILLTAIIILFFVTNVPSAVLSIIYREDLEGNAAFQVFRALANLLEMSNFALNFCVYFLCSKEFRKTFYELFKRQKKGQKRSSSSPLAPTTPASNTNGTVQETTAS